MKKIGVDVVTTASGTVIESSTVPGLLYCDIAVAGVGAVVYTKAMLVGYAGFFGLSYTANSVLANIELKIEMQQSFRLPVTEGSSDTYWAEPSNVQDIESAFTTEATIVHKSISPIPLPYIRFKITGGAGNNTDTILNMWLSKQEEF